MAFTQKNSSAGNTKTTERANEVPGGRRSKPPRVFFVITLLIPILFFILLEAGLRLLHYGIDTTQWVEVPPDKLMLNSDIAHRYFFATENVPYSNQEVFDKVKAANAFRVFVLGESSAAGYPYMPVGAFSGYLKKRLELLYPGSKIEVVNLSMTAVNTYTLRDLFPGVLEQHPDLVLIYTGHNEYYGALGVGSMESVGGNPALVNLVIYLNKFKTVELLRNSLGAAVKMFGTRTEQTGTLMSKIVKDQYIAYGSKEYEAGLHQFESNMEDILQMAKDRGVPVIMGTLTSNIKDLPPFVSLSAEGQPGAQAVYAAAHTELARGNTDKARTLFLQAKDLDGLRFRAPEGINAIIRSLGARYGAPVVEIDSAFSAVSPDGIVGSTLMTDHLHPTLAGYQLMGKLYYETMKSTNHLPISSPKNFRERELDSLSVSQCKFSRLDSLIAVYRILMLKHDWPFVDRSGKTTLDALVTPGDYIDSLAFNVCAGSIPWESAHRKAADWYIGHNNFSEFRNLVDILIDRFPVITGYYAFIINELLVMKRYDDAYSYLMQYHQIRPDAFSTKWLGIIELSREHTKDALRYLEASAKLKADDAQLLFNLAGAYIGGGDYAKALETIDRCLRADPRFPGAVELRSQLTTALSQAR
jgi:tetratricopeptide (TPR) repeat protein